MLFVWEWVTERGQNPTYQKVIERIWCLQSNNAYNILLVQQWIDVLSCIELATAFFNEYILQNIWCSLKDLYAQVAPFIPWSDLLNMNNLTKILHSYSFLYIFACCGLIIYRLKSHLTKGLKYSYIREISHFSIFSCILLSKYFHFRQ